MRDSFYTYGPPELRAWQVESLGGGKGIFRFETRDKEFARRLSKREDTRRVESTGFNHFRQTYEMEGSWRKVKRIIDRYILSAGDHNSGSDVAKDCSKIVPRVKTAGASVRRRSDDGREP